MGERPEMLHYATPNQLQRLVVPIDKSLRHKLIHKFQSESRFAVVNLARDRGHKRVLPLSPSQL